MGDRTRIEWTEATWNPLRGCSRVSEGCRNCYAEAVAARFSGPGQPYEGLATMTKAGPRWTGQVRLIEDHLLQPLRWQRPRRIFVNSTSDLFHESVPDVWLDRIFAVMALAKQHRFQVLTKRPTRMLTYLSDPNRELQINGAVWTTLGTRRGSKIEHGGKWRAQIPLPNVWLGVSVEDQAAADERILPLMATPAAVRFVSAEPLLGELDLTDFLLPPPSLPGQHRWLSPGNWIVDVDGAHTMWRSLDWVIVGGESGPGARPCVMGWVKQIVRQCRSGEVPVFVKQLGAVPTNREGQRCPHIIHRKGADMAEWPEELRVRELPA